MPLLPLLLMYPAVTLLLLHAVDVRFAVAGGNAKGISLVPCVLMTVNPRNCFRVRRS